MASPIMPQTQMPPPPMPAVAPPPMPAVAPPTGMPAPPPPPSMGGVNPSLLAAQAAAGRISAMQSAPPPPPAPAGPTPAQLAAQAAVRRSGAGMGPNRAKGGTIKKTKKMAKGGSASSRADGCATKGKTKGRFV